VPEGTRVKIKCIGAGPAGLTFAISMKLRDPAHEIEVVERNAEGVTFGWGVVFSDQTVENLVRNDPVSGGLIAAECAHWDDIDVRIGGHSVISSGHGFIGIGRKRLLEILLRRARDLGVTVTFEREDDGSDHEDFDLVIAADGANSRIRDSRAGVDTRRDMGSIRAPPPRDPKTANQGVDQAPDRQAGEDARRRPGRRRRA
jgi:anthraniloyl-CoA monooxygenase